MKPVYLDNAATTRVDPEVLDAMLPFLRGEHGNSASKYYGLGARALAAVNQARERVAALAGASDAEEIIFTSGATESINWVLHARLAWAGEGARAVTSAIEHHAVLETLDFLRQKAGVAFEAVAPDGLGRVSADALRQALRPGDALAAVMMANNEIGTVNDIAALAAAARGAGVFFFTDAVQAAGKMPLEAARLGVDALCLSAHKLHGPKGVGALYLKKGVSLEPFLHGGGQEGRRRAGTANVPGIVGMGKAAELALRRLEGGAEAARQRVLTERLWARLSAEIPKIRRNGDPEGRLPGLLSVCVEGAEGEAVLGYMDMLHQVQVSSGSACTSGSLEPSHVLLAIGLPAEVAHGSIRFALSHQTKAAEMEHAAGAMADSVARVRAMSATWKG